MKGAAIDLIFNAAEEDIKPTKTYKELCGEGVALYNKTKKLLSKEQAKMFSNFADKQLEIEAESNEVFFKEGFKIGVRLAVECLYSK